MAAIFYLKRGFSENHGEILFLCLNNYCSRKFSFKTFNNIENRIQELRNKKRNA